MKLVTFVDGRAGVLLEGEVLDIAAAAAALPELKDVPGTVSGIVGTEGRAVQAINAAIGSLKGATVQLDALRRSGALVTADPGALTSPLPRPGMILAVGMNYKDHLEEMGASPPPFPYAYIKASSAVIGDGAQIRLPTDHGAMVDWEAELAIVFGRSCHRVSEEDALNHVAGYMVANDVSARDGVDDFFANPGLLESIPRWGLVLLGKQFPTFCPLGPVLVTADELPDPGGLAISCRVNGTVVQNSNTSNMVFTPAHLISYYSQFYQFRPGDVMLTGTMGGVGFGRNPRWFLKSGDVVEVEAEKIGILRNVVA